jgi:hypothetical protein
VTGLVGDGGGLSGPESSRGADLSDFGAAQIPFVDRVDSEGLEPRIPGLIRHGQCGRGWTGASRGHCSGCHETFSSGAFDQHQRISGGIVTCSTSGLVSSEKPWGTLWSRPTVEGVTWWAQRGNDAEEDAA